MFVVSNFEFTLYSLWICHLLPRNMSHSRLGVGLVTKPSPRKTGFVRNIMVFHTSSSWVFPYTVHVRKKLTPNMDGPSIPHGWMARPSHPWTNGRSSVGGPGDAQLGEGRFDAPQLRRLRCLRGSRVSGDVGDIGLAMEKPQPIGGIPEKWCTIGLHIAELVLWFT